MGNYDEAYFKGLNSYGRGTYDCNNGACLYMQYGRCIYHIAPIQQRTSRACEALIVDEIDEESDYMV